MLVNMNQLYIQNPERAIVAFNINSIEGVSAIVSAANKCQCPVIIALSASDFSISPPEAIAPVVRYYSQMCIHDIVLHLDHAHDIESIKRVIRCGFTSVMYDCSTMPLEQNILNLKEACKIAHEANITVEGELGYLNNEEKSESKSISPDQYTNPETAAYLVNETQIDMLAVAVGNAHGLYRFEPKLNIDLINKLADAVPVPLALHGGSGIPAEEMKRAVNAGIRKLNINTDLSLGAVKAIREKLQSNEEDLRYNALLDTARKAMYNESTYYINLLSLA